MGATKGHPGAAPTPAGSGLNSWPKYPIAPLITMLSYPNRKPPRVETLAATTRGARECAGLDGWFRLLASVSSGIRLRTILLARFEDRLRRQHKAESVRHSSMPGR